MLEVGREGVSERDTWEGVMIIGRGGINWRVKMKGW